MTRLIREVRSGGQTGVDRAALDAAMANAIPYAGWIPRGRLAEDGTVPEHYRFLQETQSEDYAERTAWNVRDADATLVLHFGALAGGTLLTAECAARLEKPCLALDLDASPGPLALGAARSWLRRLRCPVTLNVAGPRASSTPAGYARARAFLDQLFADGHALPTGPGRADHRLAVAGAVGREPATRGRSGRQSSPTTCPQPEAPSMKPAATLSCLFLALVALAHLGRLATGVPIVVGDVAVPMWPSVVAAIGPGALAAWLWREQRATP